MNEIIDDIWNWITGYIEVNHKFYDYKFPPCPYAKSARLKGLVDIVAHESGNALSFIEKNIDDLVSNNKYNVRVLVFAPRYKYRYGLKKFVNDLNKKIIPKNFYAQYGIALKTSSKYLGFLNKGPYLVIIVNKLSDVLDGHQALLNTDYYKPWAKHHYDAVVTRRQEMYKKYNQN
jgi:hypothetical protein